MPEITELSEREREILRLVATGASNKEIALKLVISPNTVKVHLRNIFSKIGAASRTEATLFALRTGLVEQPGPAGPAPVPTYAAEITSPAAPASDQQRRSAWPVFGAAIILAALALFLLLRAALTPTAPAAQTSTTPITRWSERAAPPTSASYRAGAVYENAIYLIGGEDAQGTSGQVLRYDPAADTWQARNPLPTPVSRAHAVLLGEKIYLPGGQDADGRPSAQLQIYDPRQDLWDQGSPLPVALSDYAASGLDGRLYLFGGWDGEQVSAKVFAYDPASNEWDALSDLPSPRMNAAAVTPGGKIILLGGWDGSRALDRVDVYYPQRDFAGQQPWEARPPLPQPRQGLAAAAITEIIYISGGSSSPGAEEMPPLVFSSAQGDAWTALEASPRPTGEGALLLPLETRLYLFGAARQQVFQAIYTVVFPVIR